MQETDPALHDDSADEPLGPVTPDEETDAGDTPEVHEQLIPQDLPKDHPGRREAERQAEESGTVEGNT